MSAVAPSRLAALKQLQCAIFQTSYNPTSVRTGAKYLRARLRGPSMVQYYPKEVSLAKLAADPRRDFINIDEEQRLRDVEDKKKRGKGAPKKAKTKGAFCASHVGTLLMFLSHIRGQSEVFAEAVVTTCVIMLALLSYICYSYYNNIAGCSSFQAFWFRWQCEAATESTIILIS